MLEWYKTLTIILLSFSISTYLTIFKKSIALALEEVDNILINRYKILGFIIWMGVSVVLFLPIMVIIATGRQNDLVNQLKLGHIKAANE